LSLVPAGGGTPRTLSADTDAAAWAPDSRRLAFPGELDVAGSARLTVQNEDASGRRGLGERRPIYTLSWSADGKRLLYSTNAPWETERDTGRIHAVDAATGADAVVARGVDPAWSDDGTSPGLRPGTGSCSSAWPAEARRGRRRGVEAGARWRAVGRDAR
jgi:dipeptidyl aminopeptidase/acylaminoacyl peptidase